MLNSRCSISIHHHHTIHHRESRIENEAAGLHSGLHSGPRRCIWALHSRKRFSMLNAIHIPSHPCIPSMLNSIHHHTIHPKAGPRRCIQGRHSGALKRTRIAYKRFLRLQTILIPSAQRKRNSGAVRALKTKANRAFSIENREEVKPRGCTDTESTEHRAHPPSHPIRGFTTHPRPRQTHTSDGIRIENEA